MDSTRNGDEAAINVADSKATKGVASTTIVSTSKGLKRGVGILDFVLRLGGIGATLAAAATMGTTDQTLPFFNRFIQFQAEYQDLPTFMFFVIANAIASGYLFLSLPLSIVAIVRPHVTGVRFLLSILDTVMGALTIAAASASAAIVYLAHNGNSNTNWFAICQQFNDFCQTVSGAVVASFVAAVFFVFLIMLSAFDLKKH